MTYDIVLQYYNYFHIKAFIKHVEITTCTLFILFPKMFLHHLSLGPKMAEILHHKVNFFYHF